MPFRSASVKSKFKIVVVTFGIRIFTLQVRTEVLTTFLRGASSTTCSSVSGEDCGIGVSVDVCHADILTRHLEARTEFSSQCLWTLTKIFA